ncbi:hypothetical protein [Alcanivorax limicola]|uniref:hypothetical protein n=1 Tax=Alcanivorax limicola TaxID=2874102 RepID=UPI001CBE979F|nr:hypothetical protein [Alcanivorax limicola]
MADTGNRFEWRAFAKHFGALEYRLLEYGRFMDMKVSQEWYLISRHNTNLNIKIRAGKLQTKALVQTLGELEQWAPAGSATLPVSADTFQAQVLVPLRIATAGLTMETGPALLDEHDLNTRFFYRFPDMIAVALQKKRMRYALGERPGEDQTDNQNKCMGELVELEINGASLQSLCIESVHPDQVKEAAALIGLDAWRNRSYVTALRETMGLVPQAPLLR